MFESLERRALFAVTPDVTFPNADALPGDDVDAAGTDPSFVQVLADGKIITGGRVGSVADPKLRVVRFTDQGVLDTTFGGGDGLSSAIDIPDGFHTSRGVRQSDGKIIIATSTLTGFAVVRFNADGTTDTSFGGGDGPATVDGFATGGVFNPNVALTSDGKIVVIGNPQVVTNENLFVARFNADGTLDTGFADGGRLTIEPEDIAAGANQMRAHDIAAVSGGKVILLVELGTATNSNAQPALIQLDAAGDFDTAFSGDGELPFEFATGQGGEAGAVLVQGDGKVVVVGSDGGHTNITRFNANGTTDTAFGTAGIGAAAQSTQREPYEIDIDNDGNFVVAVSQAITRFTAGGDPDTQFAPGATDNAGLSRTFLDFDAQNRAIAITGGQLKRLILDDEDRPDVALGVNGTLIITGESGAADNTITVTESGSNVVVTRNGVQSTFARDQVADVDLVVFDGDDTVAVSVANFPARVSLGHGANELTLGSGNATVQGGDGVDDITIGDGNHIVEAGGGNDTVTIGDGSGSTVLGGAGDDTITTGNGDDSIAGEAGSDSIDGGARNDTLFGGRFIERVFHNLDLAGEPDGQNVLIGGDGGDLLVGAGNRDTLRGGAQSDTLVGLAGADLISGGGGKDRLAGFGGHDRLYGGAGDDQFAGGNHDDRIFGGDGDDTIFGHDSRDLLYGNDGNDVFIAQDNAIDTLDGGAGTNTLIDSDEDDILSNIETT